MKSVKPKDGPKDPPGKPPAEGGGRNAEADFHGQKRTNDTHASTIDPEARAKARRRSYVSWGMG
jgi:hypothetical protein